MEVGVYGVHFPPSELAAGAAVGAEAIVKLLSEVKGVESEGGGVTTLVTEGLAK